MPAGRRLVKADAVGMRFSRARNAFQADAFMMVVAKEDKFSINALRQDVPLQEGGWELDGLPVVRAHHHALGGAAIILQKLFRRYVQMERVAVHFGRADLPRTMFSAIG